MNTENVTTHILNLSLNPPAREAFEKIKAKLFLLREDQLLRISTDLETAAQIALATADRVEPLLGIIEGIACVDVDAIRNLRTYARACQHAEAQWEHSDEALVLIEDASKLRLKMLVSAEALVEFGIADAERVAAIRSGRGHDDLAANLLQLVYLYEELWERVQGRTMIDEAILARAGQLADELSLHLGQRRSDGDPADGPLSHKAIRERAWTLLANAYSECQRAVTCVRWHEGDAHVFAPSLYPKARRRKSEEAVPASGNADSTSSNA